MPNNLSNAIKIFFQDKLWFKIWLHDRVLRNDSSSTISADSSAQPRPFGTVHAACTLLYLGLPISSAQRRSVPCYMEAE